MAQLNTEGWTDKDSRRPEYRELYETLPFIEAYAKHTDMRIAKDGPELAIGAKRDGQQDWDRHGRAQLEFLISRGLKPNSNFLDIGCGTGRLAQQAVPYLELNCYYGVDISGVAIECCQARQWLGKNPKFMHSDGTLDCFTPLFPIEMVWAHSVITHLPPEIVQQLFSELATMNFGQFFFTYKPALTPQRSGLKQFQYPAHWFTRTALDFGLRAEPDPMEWPAGQKTMRVTRA